MKTLNYPTKTPDGITTMVLSLDFGDNIDRGVEFLNQQHDGDSMKWISKINQQVLDVFSPSMCVCGQVFAGHYDEGLTRLANAEGLEFDETLGSKYGFSLPNQSVDADATNSKENMALAYADAAEFADFIRLWAETEDTSSLSDGDEDAEDRAERWAWSCLTEQWIRRINQIRNPLAQNILTKFNVEDADWALSR